MFKVLFVCTENTCRSPMAQYLTKHLIKELGVVGLEVNSCGLATTCSSKITENAKLALKDFGISTRFKPKKINIGLLDDADLVIAMNSTHKIRILLNYECLNKTFTFEEFCGGVNIDDPYGGDLNIYRQTAKQIYNNCVLMIRKLLKEKKICLKKC